MKRNPQAFAWMLATAFVISLPAVAVVAQNPNQKNQNREQLRTSGVIKALSQRVIHLVTEEGVDWLVQLEQRTTSTYYAEAEPSWLKPGMIVQFSGTFDAKGAPQDSIRAVTVMNPRADLQLGVQVDNSITSAAKGIFKRETPNAAPQPKIVSADVTGRVAAIKESSLNVLTPNARMNVELADGAIISVELNTIAIAKVGDSIEVNGWYPKGTQGRAIVNRVTVRAKEPLKGWAKPAPKKKAAAKGAAAPDPLNGPT